MVVLIIKLDSKKYLERGMEMNKILVTDVLGTLCEVDSTDELLDERSSGTTKKLNDWLERENFLAIATSAVHGDLPSACQILDTLVNILDEKRHAQIICLITDLPEGYRQDFEEELAGIKQKFATYLVDWRQDCPKFALQKFGKQNELYTIGDSLGDGLMAIRAAKLGGTGGIIFNREDHLPFLAFHATMDELIFRTAATIYTASSDDKFLLFELERKTAEEFRLSENHLFCEILEEVHENVRLGKIERKELEAKAYITEWGPQCSDELRGSLNIGLYRDFADFYQDNLSD